MAEPKVIASREASSMASTWTEYLCLTRSDTKRFKLFTGGYQSIDEAGKYYNEKTGRYVLPKTIDGQLVIGVEEDAVLGGELTYYEDDHYVEFNRLDDPDLVSWLAEQRWGKYKGAIATAIQDKF